MTGGGNEILPRRSDVSRVLAGEVLKFRRRRSTVVMPLIMVLLATATALLFDAGARNNWFGVPSGFFVAASATAWITNVMALLLVIVASFTVAQEFALGTVKAAWVRPVGRTGWFAGKVITSGVVVTVLFLLAVAAAVVVAGVKGGFSDLMEKDYLVHTARSLGLRLLLTTGLALCALWSATVVAAAVAAKLDHAGGAIAAALGLGIAMTALSMIPAAKPFLLTTYIGLPAEQMLAMSKGLPLPLEWGDLIWRTLAVSGIYALVAYLFGRWIVGKREITS